MASKKKASKKPVKANPFSLRYFLLADDIRLEADSAKLIVFGMYADTIRVPENNVVMPRLSFLFGIQRLTKTYPSMMTFSLQPPTEVHGSFPEVSAPIETSDDSAMVSNLIIQAGGMPLVAGGYVAHLTIDGAFRFEGRFRVEVNPKAIAAQLGR